MSNELAESYLKIYYMYIRHRSITFVPKKLFFRFFKDADHLYSNDQTEKVEISSTVAI